MLIKFNKQIEATIEGKPTIVFRSGDIAEVDEIRGLFYQVRGFFIPKTDADPYEPSSNDAPIFEENPEGAPEELIKKIESELNPPTEDASTPLGESDHPEAKRSNPKDRAASTRLDLSLFPMTAICYGALGMTEGDLKYGAYNYRVAGVNASVYVAAGMRHLFKYYNGEWADQKTGVPHLASALASIGILIDAYEIGKLNDDRPPIADVADLLNEFEAAVKHLHTVFPPEKSPGRYTQIEHGEPVETK